MRPFHTQQRGAIGIIGAVTLIIIVAMLALVIDSSRLYLERRNLQRVADLAALEAASRGGICSNQGQMTETLAHQAALQSAQRNGFSLSSAQRQLQSRIGVIEQDSTGKRRLEPVAPGKPVDAVEVTVTHRIPSSILANFASLFPGSAYEPEVDIQASATAQRNAQASFSVASGLLSLVSANSPLLNPLLNGLLDGDVDLKVLTAQGIAAANVELLSFLELLRARANVGSLEDVLKTDIGLLPFVSVIGEVINQRASVNTKLNQARLLQVGAVGVTLGELLGISTATSREALKTDVNLVELLTVGALVANGTRSVDLDLNLLALPKIGELIQDNRGALGAIPGGGFVPWTNSNMTKPLVGATLQVTELPQYAYGPPGVDSNGQWLTQAKTGQVDLVLKLNDEPLGILNIGGLLRVKLDMAIRVQLAQGQAALKRISCANPSVVTLAASSEIDRISITKANSNDHAQIGVTIAGIELLDLRVRAKANLLGDAAQDMTFTYDPQTGAISPKTQQIASGVNVQLPTLEVVSAEKLYEEKQECSVPLLGFLVCPITDIVVSIVNITVANLVNLLGTITNVTNLVLKAVSTLLLQPLLSLLGLDLGYAEVTLHGVDQVPAQLVR